MLRILKILALLVPVAAFALLSVGAIWMGLFASEYNSSPSKIMLGNRPEMVRWLKSQGESKPFSFAVIGDTRGTETGERLLQTAAQDRDVCFAVHVGDFARNPDIWQHRFFQTETNEEMPRNMPMFLVPGNHDLCLDPAHRSVPSDRIVGPREFDGMYGARKIDFIYADCLFIISDIDETGVEYLAYLARVLSEKRAECRHAFVFMHIPPNHLSKDIDCRDLPQQDRLLALLKEHNVDRAFFGDFHGYWRGDIQGVHVIVTGGGGSHLAGDTTYGFYHLLVITVDDGMITERIISIPAATDWEDRFEEYCYIYAFPALGTEPWKYYLLGGLASAAALLVAILSFYGKLRRKKRERCPETT